MYPFSYTGLRLVHDEKIRNAIKRVSIDAELARNSQRTLWLSLLSSVPKLIRYGLNVCTRSSLTSQGNTAAGSSSRSYDSAPFTGSLKR